MNKLIASSTAWGAFWICGCMAAAAAEYNSLEAVVEASGIEFAGIGIGKSLSSLPSGFIRQKNIVAGPGTSLPYYVKSYGDAEYDYAFVAVATFKGKIAFKLFQIVQSDKTHCMNTTVKSVERLQKFGVDNWKKVWRQDYQVPHWKAYAGKYRFSVTCRLKEGIWLLEETRGLAAIK
jgi:hypothetical protein